jgi:predicted glycosyltransferase
MRPVSLVASQTLTAETNTRRSQQASRFLLYSHDGLGLGHLRRNLAVAHALADAAPQSSILLATSSEEAQWFELPPNADIVRLPGLRKVDNRRYEPRRLNVTSGEVWSVRASLLLATVNSFRPSVVLADKHPLGLDGELEPALAQTRAAGGKAVLGLRDVLDDPGAVRAELEDGGLYERIPEYYDRVLVYGQPDILDARREYRFPPAVAAMTRFCGYVVSPAKGQRPNGRSADTNEERPHVLATAGGGEDGFALLAAFVEAAAPRRWDAGVVSGPQCAQHAVNRLGKRASEAGVAFRRFVPDLSSEFRSLDALVCMGGYNTLTEAAASGVSTVCVPRVEPRSEQLIRARAFAHRGLLTLVEPRELEPDFLGAKIDEALEPPTHGERRMSDLDVDGARRAAKHLLQLARRVSGKTGRRGGA